MKKRIFSALLAVLMIFSTLSISVFAEENEVDTYTISTVKQLVDTVTKLGDSDTSNIAFVLFGDITSLPEDWVGIGTEEHPFSGTFDGNDYYVTEEAAKALFNYVDTDKARVYGFYLGERPEEPECEHKNKTYTYNYNGTHNVSCEDCGESLEKNVKCTWKDDKPCECGSECKHLDVTKWTLKNNGNNTHSYVCSCGHVVSTNKCTFGLITGKCIVCGTTACDHSNENYKYESLDALGHSVLCGDCGDTITALEAHTDITGKTACEKCGWKLSDTVDNIGNAVSATQQAICHKLHSNDLTYESNGNNTHNVTCNNRAHGKFEGKKWVKTPITWTEACTFGDDGKCTGCGQAKCNHEDKTYTYINNNDGTHKVICENCGEVANEAEKCTYNNGTCVCGANCKHIGTKVHYVSKVENGKNVHSLVCECGYVYYTQPCKAICHGDKCIICGGKVDNTPVTPEEPETDEHECNYTGTLSATPSTHYVYCDECNEVKFIDDCNFEDEECECGNTFVTIQVKFTDFTTKEVVETIEIKVNPAETLFEIKSVKDKAPADYEIVTTGDVEIKNGVVTIWITKVETPNPDDTTDDTNNNKPTVDKSTAKLNLDIASLRRQVFTITAEKNNGGKVSNFGKTGKSTVKWGCSKTYTFTPNDGYVIADVLVDGVSVGAVEKYTFKKVAANHTIEVIFEEAE